MTPCRRALLLCVVLGAACVGAGDPMPGAAASGSTGEGTTIDGPAGSTSADGDSADATTTTSSSGHAQTGSAGNTGDSGSTGGAVESSSSTGGDTDLGDLRGRCGVLDTAALTGEEPGFVVNTLDFGDLGFDYDLLTPGGQAVFDAGNLGGSSLYSEVISYEVLARCESAALLKTETEIEYDAEGVRTDLLVEFDGTKIGVSVTRGQGFPLEDPYSVQQAQALLEDKLADIPMSTANVAPEDAWEKQILHIIAYGPMHAQSLQTAYDALGAEFTLDTVVVVTVTDGDDLFIYTE